MAGSRDEAFNTDRFECVVSLHPHGEKVIVEGETHDGIVRNPAALQSADTRGISTKVYWASVVLTFNRRHSRRPTEISVQDGWVSFAERRRVTSRGAPK